MPMLSRILLADDDPSTLHILTHILRKWGHEVIAVTDGQQALDCLLAPDAPNMAFLDWMMPLMSGIDVCRQLRERAPSQALHLVLMTSRDSTSDLIAAMQAGVDDYIVKPVDGEQLRAKLMLGARALRRLQALEWERAQNLQNATLVSLGSMASGMAHEINNPLAIIAGTATQCLEHLQAGQMDRGFLEGKIRRVEGHVNRVAHVVRALLQFSTDSDSNHEEICDIRDLAQKADGFVRKRFESAGVILRTIDSGEDFSITCRSRSLVQSLVHLLNNSFDAVRGQPGAWIRLAVEALPNQILVRVTDSGTGIPPEVRSRMMNPFFTTKDIGEGVGLGLAIASGVLRAHNGDLSYNHESSNTEFVLQIPRR